MDIGDRDRHQIEETALGFAGIAFRGAKGNPPLIAPENVDTLPWNPGAIRLPCQDCAHLLRRTSPGERDECPTALLDRLLDNTRETFCGGPSQCGPIRDHDDSPTRAEVHGRPKLARVLLRRH